MINYNEWLVEQEGGTTLEGCKLMLNGTKLMVECECGSFDLELDEEQAADLTEKMTSCGKTEGDEAETGTGGEEEISGPVSPPPGMGGGLGEAKMLKFSKGCPKCGKKKCCCCNVKGGKPVKKCSM